jgi:hypothetical protein
MEDLLSWKFKYCTCYLHVHTEAVVYRLSGLSPVCEARIVSYVSYRHRTVSCLLCDSSHNFHLHQIIWRANHPKSPR